MNSLFVCPLCGGALTRREGSYLCPAGHCFDIAREGYTYLLPVQQKHSKAPGDDKAMAASRRAFLDKGYYAPLRDMLCKLAVALTGSAPTVLDNGCGFKIEDVPPDSLHVGLGIMKERAERIGAHLDVHPRKPGPGTSVVVHLPLAASQTPSQKDVLDTTPISLESP